MKTLATFVAILMTASAAFAQPSICKTVADIQPRVTDDREGNERQLTDVLNGVLKKQAEGITTAAKWMEEIRKSEAQHPLSIREHTALILINELGIFDGYDEDGSTNATLKESLRLSYNHLTGHDPSAKEVGKLPVSVIRTATEPELAFYQAVREKISSGEKLPLHSRIANKLGDLRDQLTITRVTALLMGAAAVVADPHLGGIVAGSLVGLAQAGLDEYTVHLGLGHASSKMLARIHKLGPLGDFLEEVRIEHQLHHRLVSQDFRAAVLSPEQIEEANKYAAQMMVTFLVAKAQRKDPTLTKEQIISAPGFDEEVEKKVTAIRDVNFGMNSSIPAAIKMLVSGAHYYIMNYAIYRATGDMGYLLASNAVMTFMTTQSIYSHYYMHYFPEYRSVEDQSRFMVWFLKTPIGQQARRRHIEHHFDRFIGAGNGNIMAFAPADVLLNDLTEISIEHLVDMQARGILPEF